MDPRERLSLRYRDPAVLGLDSAQELEKLLRVLTDVEGADDVVYHAALAQLLDLEIATLTRRPEVFSASGQISVTQGLEVRLRTLRAERRAALRAAGSTATPGTVTSVPTVVRW